MHAGAVVAFAEGGDAGTDQTKIEERRAGAGAAVEYERHWPVWIVWFRHVGSIENCGRAFAGLIEQRERPRGRSVGELAGCDVDAVLGDGIAGQQRKHSGSDGSFRPALFAMTGAVAGGPAGTLLGACRGGQKHEHQSDGRAAKNKHISYPFYEGYGAYDFVHDHRAKVPERWLLSHSLSDRIGPDDRLDGRASR